VFVVLTVQYFGRVSSDEHDPKRSEQEQYEIGQQKQPDGQIKEHADRQFV